METKEKNVDESSYALERRLMRQTSDILYEPVARATKLLSKRLRELGSAESAQKIQAQIPARMSLGLIRESGHTEKTRLQVDLWVISEIGDYVKAYENGLKEAIGNMRLSADAQMWSVESFRKMISAIGEDNSLHSNEMKKMFEQNADAFKKAKSYDELLASAAKLRGDLREIVRDSSAHFEGVARAAKAREGLRQ